MAIEETKCTRNIASGYRNNYIRGVAPCRCGASKNKPFCDVTHGTIGFSNKNKETLVDGNFIIKDKRKTLCW